MEKYIKYVYLFMISIHNISELQAHGMFSARNTECLYLVFVSMWVVGKKIFILFHEAMTDNRT